MVSKLQKPTKIEHSSSKKNKFSSKNLSPGSTPKKELKLTKLDEIIPTNLSSSLDALVTINETGAKELIIKYLMSDNISQIKSEES